jgi:hypothetical protein
MSEGMELLAQIEAEISRLKSLAEEFESSNEFHRKDEAYLLWRKEVVALREKENLIRARLVQQPAGN